MSRISINNLTFHYDGSYDDIFSDTSFNMDTDWKLGFVSRNGRGKTTLLKLLMGEHSYKGSINSTVEFDYFPFIVEDTSIDTIDVINSLKKDYEFWKLLREMSLLGVSDDLLYQSYDTLSFGERTKIMLAMLFMQDDKFLLIDEPTNHLDLHGRQLVSDYLSTKKGFILVSHDKTFLDNCIDHVLSINKADITVTKGDFSTWQYNKQLRDNYELQQNEKLKKDIKRMEIDAARTSTWSDRVEATKLSAPDRGHVGHMAAKMMKRSMVTRARKEKVIDEKSKLLKNIESTEDLAIWPQKYHSKQLVYIDNLSVKYDDNPVFDGMDLVVNAGDRIAISGRNGCGKTSLIRLIMGDELSYKGTKQVGSNLKISYVSQDTSRLRGNLSDYAYSNNVDETLLKTILRKLDFERIQFEKNIEDYSEGQKKKVLIAKSLCEKAHLYIWDEPLNYIDILSRIQIEELILKYQPTMLFVEHDEFFIDMIATDVLLM